MNKGLIFGVLTTFLWAIDAAFRRVALHDYDVKPFLFVCLSLVVGSFMLLVIGQAGRQGYNTLKEHRTWLYGTSHVLNNMFYAFSMIYITGTETAFLIKMNVLIGLTVAYFFFKRKPKKTDVVGSILLVIALSFIVRDIPEDIRWIAFSYVLLSAFFYVGRTAFAETHKEANKAITIQDKCRTTGFILLATSFLFTSLSLILAVIKHILGGASTPEMMALMNMAPDISDFYHRQTYVMALLLGLTLIPLATYTYFQAVRLLKMESMLMITGLLPFFTFITEYITGFFYKVNVASISTTDMVAGTCVIVISVAMALFKQSNIGEFKESVSNKDDYEMVCSAIRFCEGDYLKASRKLGIDTEELESIYNSSGRLGFSAKGDKYKIIARNFRRNISMACNMTGIANRDALISAMDGAFKDRVNFSIVFFDLNKFKPINDEYGHEAGDEVLRVIANKVADSLPSKHIFSRIGGDEFVLMMRHTAKLEAMEFVEDVMQLIEEPIKIKGIRQKLEVSASYGIAESGEDGNDSSTLLKAADKLMYDDKEGR